MACFSWPMVASVPPSDWVAEQKLPKPWVGSTSVGVGQLGGQPARRVVLRVGQVVGVLGPSRSVRPVAPNSSDPPVNTATGPLAVVERVGEVGVRVPGGVRARARASAPTANSSPSAMADALEGHLVAAATT